MSSPAAEPAASPPPRRRMPWNLRAAAWLRRLSPLVLAVAVWITWRHYGMWYVPSDMDTLPDTHPPGSLCVVAKRPRELTVGAVVFLHRDSGDPLVTRVSELLADGTFLVEHDVRSRYGLDQREGLGPQPLAAVEGLVLTVFGGKHTDAEEPARRGR